jgi:murein DD-endopeptidase MepM/ murein hydrolase activator NlpD
MMLLSKILRKEDTNKMNIRTSTQMERAKRKAFAVSAFLVVVMLGLAATFMILSFTGNRGTPSIDNPLDGTGDLPGGGDDTPPVVAPVAFAIPVDGNSWTVLKAASFTELQRNNTLGRWELHTSYDLGAEAGTAVLAAYAGTVTSVSTGNSLTGTLIRIRHTDGLETVYSSLTAVAVKEGDTVTRGQKIAEVGETAGAEKFDTPYVRFETYKDGVQIDPAEYADFSTK